MPIHLRQICLVARHLEPVVEDLKAVLGLQVCHVDPEVGKWGLENALLPIGSDFLEVVAPTAPGTSAGRHLDRRGGDGGYMIICQVPSRAEQDRTKDRATAHKVRVAYEADRETWRIMQLHPGDMGGAYLEVDWDQQANTSGNWMPAGGMHWQNHIGSERVTRIAGAQLQGTDPIALANHWGAVCAVAPDSTPHGPAVSLSNAQLRFHDISDGRGPGLGAIDLTVTDREAVLTAARERDCMTPDGQVIICGTRINLV